MSSPHPTKVRTFHLLNPEHVANKGRSSQINMFTFSLPKCNNTIDPDHNHKTNCHLSSDDAVVYSTPTSSPSSIPRNKNNKSPTNYERMSLGFLCDENNDVSNNNNSFRDGNHSPSQDHNYIKNNDEKMQVQEEYFYPRISSYDIPVFTNNTEISNRLLSGESENRNLEKYVHPKLDMHNHIRNSEQQRSNTKVSSGGVAKQYHLKLVLEDHYKDREKREKSKYLKRKVWTRMTPELFTKIWRWEQTHKGTIKQSDVEKKWNVNRTTYYRWKLRKAAELVSNNNRGNDNDDMIVGSGGVVVSHSDDQNEEEYL